MDEAGTEGESGGSGGSGGLGGIIFVYFCSLTFPAVNELNIFLN